MTNRESIKLGSGDRAARGYAELEAVYDASLVSVFITIRGPVCEASMPLGLDDAANLGAWLITRGLPEGDEKPS